MHCSSARSKACAGVAAWVAVCAHASAPLQAGARAPGPATAASAPAVMAAAVPALAPRGGPDSAGATGTPMAAVWKERRVDFVYLGRTVRYSCDGLRDKVRAMLLDLGARRDVKITAVGCEDNDRLRANSLEPSLNIIFSAPALPDATAKPLRTGDLAPIDARFETFTIASDTFRNMGVGDCELVEEFARQILPRLVTREVKRDIACIPYEHSGSRFFVQGEILKTLPPAQGR